MLESCVVDFYFYFFLQKCYCGKYLKMVMGLGFLRWPLGK